MARVVLSLYLIAAAAAGPWWLCCCMSNRAAQLLAALKPAIPSPEQEEPECCCGKHAQSAPAPKAPEKPAPPQLPCQCKDTQPTPLLQTGLDADELVRHCTALGDGDMMSVEVDPASVITNGTPSGHLVFPIGGGRDILASLHILRC